MVQFLFPKIISWQSQIYGIIKIIIYKSMSCFLHFGQIYQIINLFLQYTCVWIMHKMAYENITLGYFWIFYYNSKVFIATSRGLKNTIWRHKTRPKFTQIFSFSFEFITCKNNFQLKLLKRSSLVRKLNC